MDKTLGKSGKKGDFQRGWCGKCLGAAGKGGGMKDKGADEREGTGIGKGPNEFQGVHQLAFEHKCKPI